jgi:hypothetical protein
MSHFLGRLSTYRATKLGSYSQPVVRASFSQVLANALASGSCVSAWDFPRASRDFAILASRAADAGSVPFNGDQGPSIQSLPQVPKNVCRPTGAGATFTCPKCMERCSRTRVAEKSMICIRQFHVDVCLFRILECASTYQRRKRSQLLKESQGGHGLKAVCAEQTPHKGPDCGSTFTKKTQSDTPRERVQRNRVPRRKDKS